MATILLMLINLLCGTLCSKCQKSQRRLNLFKHCVFCFWFFRSRSVFLSNNICVPHLDPRSTGGRFITLPEPSPISTPLLACIYIWNVVTLCQWQTLQKTANFIVMETTLQKKSAPGGRFVWNLASLCRLQINSWGEKLCLVGFSDKRSFTPTPIP